jgi:hypothetical protein
VGISNIGSGTQAGVCTSTTRPQAPYEGQVIYETDTNRVLVWDASAWVDPSTGKLGRSGLTKIIPSSATNGTIQTNGDVLVGSAVSTVTINDAFSAVYDNYIISYSNGTCSANGLLYLRVGATTTGYHNSYVYTGWNNTVQAAGNSTAVQWERFGRTFTGSTTSWGYAHIGNPFKAAPTRIWGQDFTSTDAGSFVGYLNNTTSYTSFNFFSSSGTLTGGTVSVYGYN